MSSSNRRVNLTFSIGPLQRRPGVERWQGRIHIPARAEAQYADQKGQESDMRVKLQGQAEGLMNSVVTHTSQVGL